MDYSIITNMSSNNNNNNNNNESLNKNDQIDSYSDFFKAMQMLTGIYLLPVISIFGIIGNTFNIIVYQKSLMYSTNIYLTALYLSDIIKLFNDFIYCLVSLINRNNPELGEKLFYTLYNYTHFIFVQSGINTSWLTCTVAFDRYLAVRETTMRKNDNKHTGSIIISCAWFIVSAILAIPTALQTTVITEPDVIKLVLKLKLNFLIVLSI
jgi:hypothetical protein